MKNKGLFTIALMGILSVGGYFAQAQGLAVNSTGATADASAIMDVNSTTQGLLVPRMTTAQRTGIISPVSGLMVFQTDGTVGFYYYDGTNWQALTSAATAAGGDLTGSYPSPSLVTTGVSAGTYGSSTESPTIAVDAKGRVTSATNTAISAGGSGTVTSLASNNLGSGTGNNVFTSSVSNATTTPAITYTLTPQIAHATYMVTASTAAAPTFNGYTGVSAGLFPLGLLNTSGTASSTTYYRGDATWQTPSNNGFAFNNTNITQFNFNDYWMAPGGGLGGTTSESVDGAETSGYGMYYSTVLPVACTVDGLWVQLLNDESVPNASNTVEVIVVHNNVNTSMTETLTIDSQTTPMQGSNTSALDAITCAAGDLISLYISQSSISPATILNITVHCH